MHLYSLIQVQHCYTYLVDQIPVGLLLYSHIPTGLMALAFGAFVFIRARNFQSSVLFSICICFAVWCFFDLVTWFAFLGSSTVMVTWSLLDLVGLLMFYFSYFFLYTVITGNALPFWQKVIAFVAILPQIVITLLGANLLGYDANSCEALESANLTKYVYVIEALFIVASLALTVFSYHASHDKKHRREILLSGIGVNVFLIFFFSATFLVSIIAESTGLSVVYNYEIYGLFGMPILLIYLGYLIVRYKMFDIRIFGAQALVFSLLAVLGSEFAFVNTLANRILVSITLILTGFIGIVLIRSVRREIEQRKHIEQLATELEGANKQQVALIHFITHQLKGFVAKSRNIFAMIQEGDFGTVPEPMKPMIDEGFASSTRGAQTIQDILNAANIKNGNISMVMASFDFRELVDGIFKNLKPNADAKKVMLTLTCPSDPITMTGDRMQLENAIKNMVDNAIKYTPSGTVQITLEKDDENKLVRFKTIDTGVGITPEDMKHLFTEGGRGAESQKVNVDSTGFGLYIVKNIIEAHHGLVWAESDGAGKGSTFIIELPVQ